MYNQITLNKMNALIKTAAEKFALQIITLGQLSDICGDNGTLKEAIKHSVEFFEELDIWKLLDIQELLIDNYICNNEVEVGILVLDSLKMNIDLNSLEELIKIIIKL